MAGRSGGTARGSEDERLALVRGLVELLVEAMSDTTIRLSVVTLAERAGVARTALTHRNADIRRAFQRIREPFLQSTVDRLQAERDESREKLREANQLLDALRLDFNLSARVIRSLELQLESATQDGVTGIGDYRAKKRREGLPGHGS